MEEETVRRLVEEYIVRRKPDYNRNATRLTIMKIAKVSDNMYFAKFSFDYSYFAAALILVLDGEYMFWPDVNLSYSQFPWF